MDKYNQKHVNKEHRHPFLKKRPKSSPSLRSDSSNSHHQTASTPSYQARRLDRHGSSKLSRSTTALLWQHSTTSKEHITVDLTQSKTGASWTKAVQNIDTKQGNSWSKTLQSMQKNDSNKNGSSQKTETETKTGGGSWSKAMTKLNTANQFSSRSSPRLEAWANNKPAFTKSTSVLSSKPSSTNLLRPQTAVLLRRRLRHMVRTRIKSAAPRANSYDECSGSDITGVDEEDDRCPASAPSISATTKHNISKHISVEKKPETNNKDSKYYKTLERSSVSDETKEAPKSPGGVRTVGWVDKTSATDNDNSNNRSTGMPTSATLKDDAVKAFKSSGLKSPRHQTISETEEDTSDCSEKQYVQTVPELRLGSVDYSIPLSVTDDNRRQSVAANRQRRISSVDPQRKIGGAADMMRKNRHSRHHRLSVYLQTAAGRKLVSPLEKFRRISKTIRVIAGICLAMKSYVKEGKTKQWSLVEMQLNLKADMEKALSFDPLMFTNLHVSRGSHKLKIILSKLPQYRTNKDIDVVVALLRKNKTFANYHRETQIKLAKSMEYQRFEPRRIVLKEGHAASCYYIILSGICLVNQLDFDRRNNSQFVTTVKEIGPGECFGEEALLTDTLREYSIICKEEVELLLINRDDFMSIIRIPLENEQKELIKYCVLQEIVTDQMMENIKVTYKTVKSQYYKPGTVISKDLYKDEYIYVIKGGNCRILSEVIELSKKKTNKQAMSDDNWKKKAALKRSMSLIGGGKARRAGWAAFARKQLEKGSSNANEISSRPPTVRHLDSALNNFNAIPASEYLQAHVALQTDTKVVDKQAVARTWRRVTVAASSVSEKERIKTEEEQKNSNLVESGVKTTFALVADLSGGSVCGLETLLSTLRPDTRLCLVSDGVDCILVSKKVFNSNKNTTKTVEIANKMGTEYPSGSEQLGSIMRARKWAAYRDEVAGDVVYRREASKGKVF